MTDPRPATNNQLRAEQLVEAIMSEDPTLGAILHERAAKLFGGDVKAYAPTKLKAAIVEPEIKALKSELDTANEKLAKALARLDKRDEQDEEAKTFNEMQTAVNSAVSKYGLTEEGKQKMLDRMREAKNFTDVEAAAAYVVHNAPPPPTSGPSWAPRKTNFYGTVDADEAFQKLHKDPEGFRDEEIAKFLQNPERYAAEAA